MESSKKFKTSRRLQLHSSSKLNKKDLHAIGYEVILVKNKSKQFTQLSKEKNEVNEFSQNSSFYATQNPHVTKRTRIVLSEALLHCHLAN